MKNIQYLLIFGLLSVLLYSCKKEFTIYAPYESETIVIGILDASVDSQFVRINRTWQGTGNNLEYALIRDSSEYQWDQFNSIVVKEIINGEVINTYDLQEIVKYDKDEEGLFYGPEYTAYYFVKEDFAENATYRIDIDFKDKKDVWAETTVVVESSGYINKPNQDLPQNQTFNLASIINSEPSFKTFNVKWQRYDNAGKYSAAFLINYKEMVWEDLNHTVLVSEEDKSIRWELGEKDIDDNSNGAYTIVVNGQSFYNVIEASMEENPYISRQIGYLNPETSFTEALTFILSIANEDYQVFLSVNEPSTSIVQEKPKYTNIQNGLGIFASKTKVRLDRIKLNFTSYDAIPLIDGFAQLNICTPETSSDIVCN